MEGQNLEKDFALFLWYSFRILNKEISVNKILLVLLTLFISSCSSLKTDYNYDTQADFSKYKTVAWVDMKGLLTSYHLSGVMDERVRKGIQDAFTKKGLTFVEGNNSDLIINYLIKTNRDMDVKSFDVSFGYHPYAGGGIHNTYNTMTFTSTREYESGALIVDLVDRKTNKLLWRALASKGFAERTTQFDKLEAFHKTLKKFMKMYPPKK